MVSSFSAIISMKKHRKYLALIVSSLSLFLAGCSPSSNSTTNRSSYSMVPISKVGRILEAENSMWRIKAHRRRVCSDLPNNFLATREMYDDFELKLSSGWTLLNSGIQIRSHTYPEETTTIRWGGSLRMMAPRT